MSFMHLQSIPPCIAIPDFTPFTSVHHKIPPWHTQPHNSWIHVGIHTGYVELCHFRKGQQCTKAGIGLLCFATYFSANSSTVISSIHNPLTSTTPQTSFCCFFDYPGHRLHYLYLYFSHQIQTFGFEISCFLSCYNLSFLCEAILILCPS